MGEDKALMPFLGQPLIVRIIQRLSNLGEEVLVVTNRIPDYQFLNLPLVSDYFPGRGALGGLYTALKAASHSQVVVAACDMPFISPELLSYQIEILLNEGRDAVIPKTEFGVEPFHSVYNRQICLPLIEAALDAGAWRVNSWFKDAQIHFLSPEETLSLDPLQIAFKNVNSPEDFQEAQDLAKQLSAE
jgi:molybdenum cofactor guanylyltransferase